ncbi:MAG: FapA family protein [Clostridium sp.]|nr:FapA family protein [Acetatifactor muris]MCM1525987.1 FapA family protein [Bacteroides sp.]MCM1562253.1 FapA family protein [Clostridium sp.]
MQNGYFQLVSTPGGGFGVKFFPPKDEGTAVQIGEVTSWLDERGIVYNLASLKQFLESGKEIVSFLGQEECPAVDESYKIEISEDSMLATVRFYPPSETGKRITFNEFLSDLRFKNITSGIRMGELQDHFQSDGVYCTDLLVAKGKEPRHGTDARIEYYFNTDLRARPTLNEDGTADFFQLNIINHCHKGDLLARIIPEDEGEYGINIMGARIKPRDVKKAFLRYGKHIALSEDKLSISSEVDGHVMLVDGEVFVSDVYTVENVDISTGNIDFNGSVQVNGNVASNFTVRAQGNVIINGVVEGAYIYATGNIIIARGMNGMSKGTLRAGGNIVAKFIESADIVAESGYVDTGSILHSTVTAGDMVTVGGKRGFITGGYVKAGNKISAKNIGAEMGAPTVVEVGMNSKMKEEYINLQKMVAELMKEIREAQAVLKDFADKHAKGVHFAADQLLKVKEAAKSNETNKKLLAKKNQEMLTLQQVVETQRKAVVEVTGEVFPGTTIVIGDSSMAVQSSYKYCRFERVQGEVKMAPL